MPRCGFCRARNARRCSRSTASAGRSTTSPIPTGRAPSGWPRFSNGATTSTRSMRAIRRRGCRTTLTRCGDFGLQARGFPRGHRRHGDGRAAGHPRAGCGHARPVLRSRRERGRAAVGAGVRDAARRMASRSRIISAARCNSPTSCATSTRTPRSAGSICRAKACCTPASPATDPHSGDRRSGAAAGLRAAGRARAKRISRRPMRSWRAIRAARCGRRAIMSKYYRAILRVLVARGFASPRAPVSVSKAGPDRDPAAIRDHLMPRTVHIIGAGLSGLAAAVQLANAGYEVIVHEATAQPGGRCRSYYDAATDLTIDNGNHLVLSGNRHALRLCAGRSAAEAGLVGPERAEFPFVDLDSGERWELDSATAGCRGGCSTRPAACRAPACAIISRWRRCSGQAPDKLVGDAIACTGRCTTGWCIRCCWRRSTSIRPRARQGSPARSCARRCWRAAQACRPLIARDGLGAVLHRAGGRAAAGQGRRGAARP